MFFQNKRVLINHCHNLPHHTSVEILIAHSSPALARTVLDFVVCRQPREERIIVLYLLHLQLGKVRYPNTLYISFSLQRLIFFYYLPAFSRRSPKNPYLYHYHLPRITFKIWYFTIPNISKLNFTSQLLHSSTVARIFSFLVFLFLCFVGDLDDPWSFWCWNFSWVFYVCCYIVDWAIAEVASDP